MATHFYLLRLLGHLFPLQITIVKCLKIIPECTIITSTQSLIRELLMASSAHFSYKATDVSTHLQLCLPKILLYIRLSTFQLTGGRVSTLRWPAPPLNSLSIRRPSCGQTFRFLHWRHACL